MDFDKLPEDAKEALTPCGEYLRSEKLNEAESFYKGAPTGPVPFGDERGGADAPPITPAAQKTRAT